MVVLGAGAVAGCTGVTSGTDTPIAIEVSLPATALTVQEFDTLPLRVHVLNRAGDSIAGARVRLVSLNPDTVGVDSAATAVIGIQPGQGRVVAYSGALASDPFAVTVTRAPDSLGATSALVDTVPAADTASAALAVELFDLRTTPGTPAGLAGDTVRFTLVAPAFASPASATVLLGNDSLAATLLTGTGGTAQTTVVRHGPPPQPDSVVVRASATRGNGQVVTGSPVTFVIHFQ